ncbi:MULTISPECIES: NUDIX domain-containing protein [Bacillus]|uniref:NUDIX domain-containing protein n=1 Tax=Bacillus TaxID=1386 RepID=UPI0002DA599B|nr:MULTISPECIES: NUDIX hydrolase [Bacillus]
MSERCRNVWLAVCGIVINKKGEWLIVKKKYGGLKGFWSLPAGFVKEDETVDEAAVREIKEETGIDTEVKGMLGMRSGVLSDGYSDNMVMFLLKPLHEEIVIQYDELYEAVYMSPEKIQIDPYCSPLLKHMMTLETDNVKRLIDNMDPGNQFGYLSYKLFL